MATRWFPIVWLVDEPKKRAMGLILIMHILGEFEHADGTAGFASTRLPPCCASRSTAFEPSPLHIAASHR
jgi:hypothetical protein